MAADHYVIADRPQVLAPGDRALLRHQPLVPPVRIKRIEALPWGVVRVHWQHEAEGFGHSPQHSDGPASLIPLPRGYRPPPDNMAWPAQGYFAAALAWLDDNRTWLADAYGAERIAVVRRYLANRLRPDPARDAVTARVGGDHRKPTRHHRRNAT